MIPLSSGAPFFKKMFFNYDNKYLATVQNGADDVICKQRWFESLRAPGATIFI